MLSLIDSAQDLTASWVDLGDPVNTNTMENVGLWLNVDINNSLNARVRALAQKTKTGGTGDEYVMPIRVVTASDVKVEPEYIEFNNDADQLMILAVGTDRLIPFIQFQVQAGTVGATAGQIDTAHVSFDNFS
jgi:hypothetical protein